MNFRELRAEVLKKTETQSGAHGERGGRPVRKRGYYRALKRQEPWAHMKLTNQLLLKDIERQFFGQMVDDSNSLLTLVPKDDSNG